MGKRHLTSGFRRNVKKRKQKHKASIFQIGKAPSKHKVRRIKPHNKKQRKHIIRRFKR